jgi:hypothetical protein
MKEVSIAVTILLGFGHLAVAQSKYEIVFTSAGFAETGGATGYGAYIRDRQANKGNYCTAHYFRGTAEKPPTLT